jgi:hypothetical protein
MILSIVHTSALQKCIDIILGKVDKKVIDLLVMSMSKLVDRKHVQVTEYIESIYKYPVDPFRMWYDTAMVCRKFLYLILDVHLLATIGNHIQG